MAELDEIFEDETAWLTYEGAEGMTICVYARCLECGRYIKHGRIYSDIIYGVRSEDWICSKCGEVEPYVDSI